MEGKKSIPVLRCKSCGQISIPPQYVCRRCGSAELNQEVVSGHGKVYTYTIIRVAPKAFENQIPYHVLIVELSPDLRISARLADEPGNRIDIGEEVILDRIDDAGYWFRSAGGSRD